MERNGNFSRNNKPAKGNCEKCCRHGVHWKIIIWFFAFDWHSCNLLVVQTSKQIQRAKAVIRGLILQRCLPSPTYEHFYLRNSAWHQSSSGFILGSKLIICIWSLFDKNPAYEGIIGQKHILEVQNAWCRSRPIHTLLGIHMKVIPSIDIKALNSTNISIKGIYYIEFAKVCFYSFERLSLS